MTLYIIIAFSTFIISLIGTRLTILALRKRTVLLDRPNLRSNHKVPTPRGGGIAVVTAMVIGLLLADINYAIILAIFMLAAVSLLDDIVSVHPLIRLLVQILAVMIPVEITYTAHFSEYIPLWLEKTALILAWVWFINLFNFMDGIDGISAAEMISISAGICMIITLVGAAPDNLFIYSVVVATAGAGFIWWNWHPAKIFLGDVGSIPIGFMLGYLLLLTAQHGYPYAALILPGYYLADGTITLLSRLARGKKIWQAHSEHYYQKAVRSGRSHNAVVCYIIGLNILLALLATLSVLDTDLIWLHLAVAGLAICLILGFFAHEKHNPDYEPF